MQPETVEHIIVMTKASDGYAVTVVPAVPGFDFDAAYPDLRAAATYARGVRRYRGFAISDQTGEGAYV